jgi:hypothetical protein
VTLLAEQAMAVKQPDERDDVAVKIDRLVADKARLVAARRGITLAAYLTELVVAPVEKDFAEAVRAMGAPAPTDPPTKKPAKGKARREDQST